MSSSEHLFKAALSRISARIGKKLVNTASDLSQKAKETPEQIKVEWELLKEEIINEANRIEEQAADSPIPENQPNKSLEKIDSIKEKMATLTKIIEDGN